MAKTAKQLFSGSLTTTLTTTLYTAPALTPAAIVKEITVANNNITTARNVTITVNGKKVTPAEPVPPSSKQVIALSTVMATGQTIQGGQDTGTDVDVTISGIEYS